MKQSTTTNRTISTSHSNTAQPRRGLAMLLVIVALAVVTVSTSAYLASRLNAPDASENVARAVKARVTSESGAELATAILQSDSVDWRTAHVNGVLLDNYDFGQGTITIRVADINGNPPTADTTDIILTAEGSSEGIVQSTELAVTAPTTEPEVQFDLGEFAIFGKNAIWANDSKVIRWDKSPDASIQKPIRIGTNATKANSFHMQTGARFSSGNYYVLSGASANIYQDTSGMLNPLGRSDLYEANPIPLPKGPTPDISYDTEYPIYHPTVKTGDWPLTETTAIAGNLRIEDSADVLMATPNVRLLVNGDLSLLNGGDIIISAPVIIVVNGDLAMTQGSSIELIDGGSVELYLNGNFSASSATIGLPDDLTVPPLHNPANGIGYYQDPSRFKVYQLPTSAAQSWTIFNKSYACAQFNAPNVYFVAEGNSAVFGNVVGDEVEFWDNCALFYDSVLDSGWGYTNPDSFLYTADGDYDTNVTNAAIDLNPSTILTIENYVRDVSSQLANRQGWDQVTVRMTSYGMTPTETIEDD